MYYIICLLCLLFIYVAVLLNIKRFKNTKVTNFVFVMVTLVCYLSLVVFEYFHDGIHDWNFKNTLPTANVSPFMFASLLLYFVLPKKIKKYHLTLISLLSLGMILSVVMNCTFNAVRDYRFIPQFMLDYVAHLSLSLLGVYLVKSNQVTLDEKESLISGAIIVDVATYMLIINIIFDTTFFGLNLNGKHSIYNNVLVKNSYLSALIYFAGLIGVLLLGYFYVSIFKEKRRAA